MKFGPRLAALLVVIPGVLNAGDFTNPTPFGLSGGQGSGASSFSTVTVATAEQLRIANMNVGQPTTVTNVYNQVTSVSVGDVTIGDGATDVTVTNSADGVCVNTSNNILNAPVAPTDLNCDQVQN
jgi:hypothetical protein